MEIRHYVSVVLRWWWLVLAAVIIAAASSFIASHSAVRLYRASTTLMVGRVIENPDPASGDLYTGSQLAATYTQLAQHQIVLEGALKNLGLDWDWRSFAGRVNAIPQNQLIEISVIDSDAVRAKYLADAIAQQLISISPSGSTSIDPEQINFTQVQLQDLRTKIESSQNDLVQLRQELDAANSARQIQELESKINLLENKISGWQATYSQMLTTLQGGDINTLSIVEEAAVPVSPISPNTKMNVLLASAIGVTLAIGGIFLIEYLDDTIKTPEELNRATHLPVLGTITRIENKDFPERLITARQPRSPQVEAFRILRVNIEYSNLDQKLQSIMFTSPNPQEGKSTILANLAVVIAQSDMRILLIDADLRRPILHNIFELPNYMGLSEAILNPDPNGDLKKYIQSTTIPNLSVITSGTPPPNSGDFISSPRLGKILANAREHADIVLVDTPPSLIFADSAMIGNYVDGAIIVIKANQTRTKDTISTVTELQRLNTKIVGLILNDLRIKKGNDYRYYRYEAKTGQNGLQEITKRLSPGNQISNPIANTSNGISDQHQDNPIQSAAEAARLLGTQILGYIGEIPPEINPWDFAYQEPDSLLTESFRVVRNNIDSALRQPGPHAIMISSSCAGEGKSTLASNLAAIYAQSGRKVILVDCDFYHPFPYNWPHAQHYAGLSEFLRGQTTIDEILLPTEDENILVLPSGALPSNPSKLLNSPRTSEILTDLRTIADVVIIDGPPILDTEGIILSDKVDGIILIVRPGITSQLKVKEMGVQAKKMITQVLGVVINDLSAEKHLQDRPSEMNDATRISAPISVQISSNIEPKPNLFAPSSEPPQTR